MKFCTVALAHTAGEVREKAEKIIVALYKDRGSPVKNFLPPDDDKTRKNVLYKQLFEAFDRIDGKPTKQELRVSVFSKGPFIRTVKVTVFLAVLKWVECILMVLFTHDVKKVKDVADINGSFNGAYEWTLNIPKFYFYHYRNSIQIGH